MKLYLIMLSLLFELFSFAQDDSNNPSPKIRSLEDCISYALENNINVKDTSYNFIKETTLNFNPH